MIIKNLFSVLFVAVLLTGCSTAKKIFGEVEQEPLEGERISVLQYQKEIEPTPTGLAAQVQLPEAWDNKYWPQAGGYPNHAMGHVQLPSELKKSWSVSVGKGEGRGGRRILITTPVIADGLVFTLDAYSNLSAYDVDNGSRQWRVSLVPENEEKGGAVGGGIAYAHGRLFVTTGFNNLVSLDPKTGKKVWEKILSAPVRAAPSVAGEQVFVATLNNKLLAYHTGTGEMLWDYTGYEEITNLLGAPSPAVDRNIVVATFSSGEIFAFRTENGKMIWGDNLSNLSQTGALTKISDIRGLPVIDKGIVYAVSYGGRMVAIDERTGARIWQREIGGSETPWAAGNAVYILTSDQKLVALSRHSGDVQWITKLRGSEKGNEENLEIWTGPILAGGRLLLASNEKRVIEVDPVNGDVIKKWKTGGKIIVAPVVADNTLFLLTNKGSLIAYR